jgi:hypothetical protein
MNLPLSPDSPVEFCQQNGFIQVCIAKVQPQPAKMSIMLIYAISSGESDFGSDQPQIHFIGEK